MKSIKAIFQPKSKSSQNHEVNPPGAAREFDVTWTVLQLPLEEIQRISDSENDAKALSGDFSEYYGAFSIQVKQSIADYFDVEDLLKITQVMLDDKKSLVQHYRPVSDLDYSDGMCPCCGAFGTYEIDSCANGWSPSVENSCKLCEAVWIDDYQLEGYVPADGSGPYIAGNGINSIVALFQPLYRVSQNQEESPAGKPQNFDVTWRVLHMPIKKLRAIQDDSEGAQELIINLHDHTGPFSVQVRQSIADFFGVNDLRDITQAMRNKFKPLVDKPPMSDYEFVAAKGFLCPYCGSRYTEEGEIEYLEKAASRTMSCEDCEAEWIEVYEVSGYHIVKVGHVTGKNNKVNMIEERKSYPIQLNSEVRVIDGSRYAANHLNFNKEDFAKFQQKVETWAYAKVFYESEDNPEMVSIVFEDGLEVANIARSDLKLCEIGDLENKAEKFGLSSVAKLSPNFGVISSIWDFYKRRNRFGVGCTVRVIDGLMQTAKELDLTKEDFEKFQQKVETWAYAKVFDANAENPELVSIVFEDKLVVTNIAKSNLKHIGYEDLVRKKDKLGSKEIIKPNFGVWIIEDSRFKHWTW